MEMWLTNQPQHVAPMINKASILGRFAYDDATNPFGLTKEKDRAGRDIRFRTKAL